MSGDEVFLGIFATIFAIFSFGAWYLALGGIRTMNRYDGARTSLMLVPGACLVLIFAVLRTLASHDVVDDFRYIYVYLALGMGWVGFVSRLFGLLGLSPRDDVMERGNAAAVPAVCGAMLGLACCYAGGNIGDGPGWWVVVFAAALASAAWFLVWALLEQISAVSESVTVERDVAAGWRLGGLLLGCGLIFGRAAAGDWVSAAATFDDFVRIAWPALPLVLAAATLERASRASVSNPEPSPVALGVIPALAYVGVAAGYVLWRGMPA